MEIEVEGERGKRRLLARRYLALPSPFFCILCCDWSGG